MAETADLLVRIEATTALLRQELARAEKSVGDFAKGAERHAKGAETAFQAGMAKAGSAVKGFGAALVGLGLLEFGRQVVETTAKFQKLEASLTTVTGSVERAKAAFGGLQEFAARTPFSLEEVTQAFIKLKSLGLTPSQEALTAYGNVAAAMGTSLTQFIEAVADATTGEFERLKEFGIRASSEGDKVRLTFQGVTTTIGKNSTEIESYLRKIGEVQFGGAMARQAETVGGAISNLGDQWSQFLANLGNLAPIQAVVSTLASLLEMTNDLLTTTDQEFVDLAQQNLKGAQASLEIEKKMAAARGNRAQDQARVAAAEKEVAKALEIVAQAEGKLAQATKARKEAEKPVETKPGQTAAQIKAAEDAAKRLLETEAQRVRDFIKNQEQIVGELTDAWEAAAKAVEKYAAAASADAISSLNAANDKVVAPFSPEAIARRNAETERGLARLADGFNRFIFDAEDGVMDFGAALADMVQYARDTNQSFEELSEGLLNSAAAGNALGNALGSLFGRSEIQNRNAQIGGTIGSMIPGLPPGVGSFLGNLVGGLFGPGPSVGPIGTGEVIGRNGRIQFDEARVDNNGDPNNARRLANSLADLANTVLRAGGGRIGREGIDLGITQNQRSGRFALMFGGQAQGDFGSEEEAIAAAVRKLVSEGIITGLSGDITAIVQRAGTSEKITEALGLLSMFDQLRVGERMVGSYTLELEELNATVSPAIETLRELGVAVGDLEAVASTARGRIAERFQWDQIRSNRDLRGVGGINQLEDLVDGLVRGRADAAALGVSDNLVLQNFDLAVRRLLDGMDDTQLAAILGELATDGVSLRGGDRALTEVIVGIGRGFLGGAAGGLSLADATAALDKAREGLLRSYQSEIDTQRRLADQYRETAQRMRGFASGLRDFRLGLLTGEFSPLSPEARFQEAQRQFRDVATRAQLGDVDAMGRIEQFANAYLEANRDFFGSTNADAFNEIQAALQGTESVATLQYRLAEDQLKASETQISLLQDQIDGLRGVEDAVLSVADALARYQDAIANVVRAGGQAPAFVPTAPSTPAPTSPLPIATPSGGGSGPAYALGFEPGSSTQSFLTAAYRSVFGRDIDPLGLTNYSFALDNGLLGRSQILSELIDSAEGRALRGFAAGGMTNFGEMVRVHSGELLYTGPDTRVFNAADTSRIFGAANGNNVEAAVKELRAEVARLTQVVAMGNMAVTEAVKEQTGYVARDAMNADRATA